MNNYIVTVNHCLLAQTKRLSVQAADIESAIDKGLAVAGEGWRLVTAHSVNRINPCVGVRHDFNED